MSLTLATIQTDVDTTIGDSSTDRISAAQRLSAITEATAILAQKLGNDHSVVTTEFNFYDSVNYYKITSTIADMIEPTDLVVVDKEKQDEFITRKSPQELRVMIGYGYGEEAYAVERRDSDLYLIINHASEYSAKTIAAFESLTEDGTWAVDATNSDATNLTVDENEYKEGNASLNFDIDVSQSANNRATIINSTLSAIDMSDDEDLSSFIFWTYIPDVTNFTSVTLYWGSDSSNYWSATATTDIDGASFVDGWNEIKIDWSDATKTSSPDVENIDYIRIDWNYGAGQGDDTDFRIDNLRLVRRERMRLHYLTWNVGTNSTGTDLTSFAATTDIPFFSGKYDQYRWFVSHKAAAILFRVLRLSEPANAEEMEAERAFRDFRRIFPSSMNPEIKSFKVKGINLSQYGRR